MSHRVSRNVLLGLEVFTGVMALYGGVSLLLDASGFGVKEEWLRGSPFSNYQIPALGLLVLVAGGNLVAAAFLYVRHRIGLVLSMAAGVVLMGFEVVETFSFGLRNFQQPLMFVIGLVIAGLALQLWGSEYPRTSHVARSLPAH